MKIAVNKNNHKPKNKRRNISNYLQESMNFYLGFLIEKTEKLKSSYSSFSARKTWIDQDGFSMSPIKANRLVKLFNQLSYNNNINAPRIKKSKWQTFKKDSSNFLAMLSQKANPNPVFNFTTHDGMILPKKTIQQIEGLNLESKYKLSFTPLKLGSSDAARQLGLSPNGGRYYTDMRNSKLSLSIKESPPKKADSISPHRFLFRNKDSYEPLHMDSTCKIEKFEFTVTKARILKRIGSKRPCSQKKLFDGVSALEYLLEIGLILLKKQKGQNFHLAHREGWSLGGQQSKENIDPMAAGANYATLFKVEEPIKNMLFKGYNDSPPVESVRVKGEVIFAKEKNIPFKITYQLLWGDDHQLEIYIDPLNARIPTLKENEVAKKFGWATEMDAEFPILS